MNSPEKATDSSRQGWITDLTRLSQKFALFAAGVFGTAGCSDMVGVPPDIDLVAPPGLEALTDPNRPEDDLKLVKAIRLFVVENSPEKTESEMRDYTWGIPATKVPYEMVAIPGGEFLMGSPSDEKDRSEDEGPQREMKVEPFWMGKYEVTWDMFEPFMITDAPRNKDGSRLKFYGEEILAEVVTSPTTPYSEMSFGMGIKGYPAVSMTQHAASKFCQWLSAQTGHYYRLPTEAEWEYACRAGTTGPYHCPPEKLAEYAVFDPDQTRVEYEKVGTRKPNPWGLYDMHGNVFEWCLDQYFPDAYQTAKQTIPATKVYPRVVRGGSWWDMPKDCRSATRLFSDPDWKQQDPMLPKSLWYHTDAMWNGFRIVRPLKIPPAKEMEALWNSGRRFENDEDNE